MRLNMQYEKYNLQTHNLPVILKTRSECISYSRNYSLLYVSLIVFML